MATIRPSATVAPTLTTMVALCDWAGLKPTDRDAAFAAWGMTPEMPPSTVAAIPMSDYQAAVGEVRVSDAPLPLAAKGTLYTIRLVARCLCQLDPWPEDAAAATAASASAHTTALALPGSVVANIACVERFKLNTVSDQTSDVELAILPDSRVVQLYDNYREKTGGMPPADEDPSAQQLTVISTLTEQLRIPYVDFALFVPHALRNAKKLKLAGSVFGSDGRLLPVEMFGPPSFDIWERSYTILSTALMMLKAVSITALNGYRALIRRYASRYGPSVWHLIYQCDVRMRSEQMERLRIIATSEYQIAKDQGLSHAFDPSAPFEFLWKAATGDITWWREELEEGALLVLTRSSSIGRLVDGDAAIVHGPAANPARVMPPPPARVPPPTALFDGPPAKSKRRRAPAPPPVWNLDGAGWTTNRRGYPMCPGFQAGTCTVNKPGTQFCSLNPSNVHQCRKCLGHSHGSEACQSPIPSAPPNQGKGKGKGKGKKGKKGGYHG